MRIQYLETIELENGRMVSVDLELVIIYERDFGADADGNRGVACRILDDYDYTCSDDLTADEKKELDKAVKNLVERKMFDGEIFNEDAWQ